VALVLPMAVMLFWLARGLDSGVALRFAWDAAFNSVYASALAAGAAVAAALPIALLSARHPSALSSLLERASYVGFGLPGISVALALVFFAANYTPALYQTLWLLVFAYVVRFLPQALGSVRSSLLQVNPRTEEAARGLGHGRAAVFTRVTAPQVLPGVSAGAGLVFLTAMKELPATLLLSPIGFENLATQIWSATQEALFAQAALPALVLVAVSSVPMLASVLRERRAV
jgi:iron(III) transport system permease protein